MKKTQRSWNSTLRPRSKKKEAQEGTAYSTLKQSGFKADSTIKPKKSTKSTRSGLADKWMQKADGLWSRLIALMHGHRCMMCNARLRSADSPPKDDHLPVGEAHHGIGRGVKLFRHDPKNGFYFCSRCHKHDEKAPHKSADKFMEWLREKYPDRAQWIKEHQGQIGTGKPDYEARCIELQLLIDEYKEKALG